MGIFHSVSWPHYKEEYLNQFKSPTCKKRIVIATSALSMGVNFPDVENVINWGPYVCKNQWLLSCCTVPTI